MTIVARSDWGATGKPPARRMTLPAKELWLHHTVTSVSDDPAKDMRAIEKIGIQRFGHISYSYCVHPDGTILEGCGNRVGAHTAGRNSTSFGVALIGDYSSRSVTVHQLDSVRWLVAHLLSQQWLPPGAYPTGGHRDISATACPGNHAYPLLDVMRIPWCENETPTPEEPSMSDNPDVPNITGPLTFHPVVSSDGQCTGYYVFAPTTGEVHGHGPGAPYHGRSEDPTPG